MNRRRWYSTAQVLTEPTADRFRSLHCAAAGKAPARSNDAATLKLLDELDTDTFVDAEVPVKALTRQLLRDRTWRLFDFLHGPLSATFA